MKRLASTLPNMILSLGIVTIVAGARSVIGRNPASYSLYVTKDKEQHGEVDGITAATISSRAFLETLRHAFEAYENYRNSGATAQNEKK